MRSPILVLSFIFGIAPAIADGLQVPGITANGQGQLPSMANGVAPSTIWSATARQTMASASDVSCFSATGNGPGLTIPANGPYAGNQYLLNCIGVYSVPNLNAATVTAKVKWGATTVTSVVVPAIAVLTTNFPFSATASCTIITPGATGTAAWSTVAGGQTASTIISNALILY